LKKEKRQRERERERDSVQNISYLRRLKTPSVAPLPAKNYHNPQINLKDITKKRKKKNEIFLKQNETRFRRSKNPLTLLSFSS